MLYRLKTDAGRGNEISMQCLSLRRLNLSRKGINTILSDSRKQTMASGILQVVRVL
jgi:hypothetical protein